MTGVYALFKKSFKKFATYMFKTRGGSKAIWTMLKKLRFWWMMASLRKQVFELRLFARITEKIMATWRPEVDLPWDDTSQDSQLAMLRPFHLRVIFRPKQHDWLWWRGGLGKGVMMMTLTYMTIQFMCVVMNSLSRFKWCLKSYLFSRSLKLHIFHTLKGNLMVFKIFVDE